jgi:predicted transglutaminase-like cysteine proteinase
MVYGFHPATMWLTAGFAEQSASDGLPLRLNRPNRGLLSRLAVPILGVALVAFEPMTRLAIETINRSVISAVRYVSDQRQHAVPDLWSAPLATFASGQGDCEDYAIAKYVALRQLRFGAEDLFGFVLSTTL